MKKLLETSLFYTYVLKMTIVWCTAPDIWSATHFFSFWASFSNLKKWKKISGNIILLQMSSINEDHMIYDHMKYNVLHRICCHFGSFLLFHPPNDPENQSFEKLKKIPEDVIILHMGTINHMIKWQSYDVWFLRYGVRQTDISFIFGHFLFFYPTNNPQNQNFEKMKKTLEIIS